MKILILALFLVSCRYSYAECQEFCNEPQTCQITEKRETSIETATDAANIFAESKQVALAEILDTIGRLASSGHRSWTHWYQDKQFTHDIAAELATRGFKTKIEPLKDDGSEVFNEYQLTVSW